MPHYYPLFTLIYLATNEFNDTDMQASRCVTTKIALPFFNVISFVLTLPIKQMKVFITSTLAILQAEARARKKATRRPKNGLYRNKVIRTCVRKP